MKVINPLKIQKFQSGGPQQSNISLWNKITGTKPDIRYYKMGKTPRNDFMTRSKSDLDLEREIDKHYDDKNPDIQKTFSHNLDQFDNWRDAFEYDNKMYENNPTNDNYYKLAKNDAELANEYRDKIISNWTTDYLWRGLRGDNTPGWDYRRAKPKVIYSPDGDTAVGLEISTTPKRIVVNPNTTTPIDSTATPATTTPVTATPVTTTAQVTPATTTTAAPAKLNWKADKTYGGYRDPYQYKIDDKGALYVRKKGNTDWGKVNSASRTAAAKERLAKGNYSIQSETKKVINPIKNKTPMQKLSTTPITISTTPITVSTQRGDDLDAIAEEERRKHRAQVAVDNSMLNLTNYFRR